MNESIFSTYWYRVANLKPMLRPSVSVSRHVYRGQPWYILTNGMSGRNHRFNASAYAVIGLMDGQRTVSEIWENCGQYSQEVTPTQDELIRLLGLLHEADLVQSDILPSTQEMVDQYRGAHASTWKQRASNPFSMRFPLFNPERLLDRWVHLSKPLFSRTAFVMWMIAVVSAVIAAAFHWPELTGRFSDQLVSPTNLMLLWLVYPLVKILHEFGHAFAVKRWGGEVREMGITLLAFTPIPYVDATASAAFADKRQRMAVAAMGMVVETAVAVLALLVWLNVETGVVSAVAYNVMLIAGVSTVIFNGNPLLRYDGYYILVDLIEIPNLAQRSTRYMGYLVQRYVLGADTPESPVTAKGEQAWFIFYGPVAFCYRIAVLVGLVWLVSSFFHGIGIAVALWGVISLIVLPAVRTLTRFFKSPAARQQRTRLIAAVGGLVAIAALIIFVVPLPNWTTTQGVVWLPEQSTIRTGTDSEIMEVLAHDGQVVTKGDPLIRGGDVFLDARIRVQKAQLEELYATYNGLPLNNRVKRKLLTEEIELVKEELRHAKEEKQKLWVRSPADGRFVLADAHSPIGRFIKKGTLIGYILTDHLPTVRAVVSQADISLVRQKITGVEVRLAEQLERRWRADIQRISPAADLQLPSSALGTSGGGDILVDPTDPDGLRSLNTYFEVDLQLPGQVKDARIGGRVHVRLNHGTMTLGAQWYRKLRQLFLRKFYV